ncbi:MAG: peptidoglycan-binding protein [Candidatus Pacebacteria bacterium]|nr:peptidoglycan-binding protein [Candidatus Paceibacterota bacterium]MBP9832249.1 peptidoglycan-binding protein [Candidatus Paceibacterota bacterium]
MTSIVNSSLTKVAAIVVAVSLVAGFAFTFTASKAEAATLTSSQISAIVSLLQSFGADASTIANVSASLNGTAPTGGSTGGSMTGGCTFTRNLTVGSKGDDVTCLQKALIAAGYSVPAGATGYFGSQTVTAVIAWQKAAGVSPAAGYFGAISRAAFGKTSGGSTPVVTTPTGTGLAVAAGTQPANSLSPQGASRVPFTRFTLTAGADGDVVVNGVTVQKDGLGQDAAFAGIVLIDESTGLQLGIAKTLNSNHQTVVGGTFTVAKGTTKTFLLAGNMNSSLTSYVGEAPGIALVAVNTSATVSGSLPIVGAHNTNNNTLTVGSITLNTSNAFASNSNQTKEIGTTAYKSTGLRLTAGSAEDLRLKSVRWNQTGSVSSTDIANVMTVVNGTAYPATVSADGKYYDTNLGSGVVIPKGNQVDLYVQYDIVGAGAANRTVVFDVDKTTDIYATGETYGYGVSPAVGASSVPTSRGTITITSGTPFVYSTQVTVSGASITSIGKANEVPAQNIAINLPNQPLGGYVVDLKGEAMTVQSTVFTIASTTGSGTGLLTNLTIVDQNGAVVAGPVDGVYASATTQTATFTDSITYKVGRGVYTLRGKVASNIGNGGTYIVTTVPSSGWTNVKGETTGNTISLSSNGTFTMNTMTVKAGAVAVGRATSPASQNITAGGSQTLFVNFQYDATQSGEDVRFSSIPTVLTFATGAVTDLTACAAYDGTTQLSTGSNVVNPSGTSGATQTFTLDNPVTVAKGTVKTIGIKCNVSGSAANNGTFAFDAGAASAYTFTGATSGTTITGTDTSDSAVTMTVAAGSATVALDASSPGFTLVSAGSTDVVVGALKFRASNEAVNLTKVGLTLTNTASSSSSDLVKATIWNGATKVGEAYFSGSNASATSTLTSIVSLPKNTDVTLTIKADINNVGTGEAVAFSGHLLAVDYLNSEGTGASSGITISPTGSSASSGVRIMKSFPVFALDSTVNGTTGLADGRLMRFKVTADAKGPLGITQFALNLATTTASVTNVTIYGFTDSGYSQAISGISTSGDLQATDDATVPGTGNVVVGVTNSGGTATSIQIPAGGTRYFEVRGSVSGSATGAAVTTKLLGSSAFPSTAAAVGANPLLMTSSTGVDSATNTFVWSPNSTTTAVRADQDWTNGYGVSGLPAGGLFATRSH